jgi:hypothetical protein
LIHRVKGVQRRREVINMVLAEPDRLSTRRSTMDNGSRAQGRRHAFFK